MIIMDYKAYKAKLYTKQLTDLITERDRLVKALAEHEANGALNLDNEDIKISYRLHLKCLKAVTKAMIRQLDPPPVTEPFLVKDE